MANLIFDPNKGLGLNVVRYNVARSPATFGNSAYFSAWRKRSRLRAFLGFVESSADPNQQ